jgi:toxin FitB
MILLDTNVLFELMKTHPSKEVVSWMNQQPASMLAVSSVTEAELFCGIELLADGKRKEQLHAAVAAMFEEDFSGRVLSFDSATAHTFARIAVHRQQIGKPISQADAQIAAIAVTNKASLATRNIADFEGCGVKLIDPWND